MAGGAKASWCCMCGHTAEDHSDEVWHDGGTLRVVINQPCAVGNQQSGEGTCDCQWFDPVPEEHLEGSP